MVDYTEFLELCNNETGLVHLLFFVGGLMIIYAILFLFIHCLILGVIDRCIKIKRGKKNE